MLQSDEINKPYLIIGNGYLGNKFLNYFSNSKMCPFKINSEKDAADALKKYNPSALINCAGATGVPNVDWCEDHHTETFAANVTLPINIAKACQKANVKMIHLGSGCIYTGDNNKKGFSETDTPNFGGSFYSITKALSEKMLLEFDALQLRLRMPVDFEPSPRNFITKITNYKKVINELNSMSVVEDLLKASETLIEKNCSGIYNVTNPDPMKHKEILEMYKEIVNPNLEYELITMEELAKFTKAGRSNCVLNTEKLEKKIALPPLKKRIKEILQNYKETK
jgi:dTDP-4-dehydrorhamnose reductase